MSNDRRVAKTGTVKDLFDSGVAAETKRRVMELQADSQREWGTMSVAQTLAHCTSGLEMAMGVIQPKRAPFPANVMGLLIKPLVLGNDTPMRRNSPSSPELFSANQTEWDFERERANLVAAIDRFAGEGAACCTEHPHPFFGSLKPQQWAILMYKHLDHHLRQFGV
jgi:hypothetical protein